MGDSNPASTEPTQADGGGIMNHDFRYRFHGRIPPKSGREPIKAFVEPSGPDSDGVATIRLYDPVDSWGEDFGVSAKEFVTALDGLGSDVKEIRLHINSPGGEVFEGIAIMNALRNHPARVVAIADGLAASAASFIACSADTLIMGRNSELMIHTAWGICIGDADDMRDLAGKLDHMNDNIASIYAAKAGGTTADWLSPMRAETWYSADEAVAAGLADRVETAEPAAAENHFDLSVFTYAGRAAAPDPKAERVDATGDVATEPIEADDMLRLRHRLNARKLRVRT